MSRIKRLNYPGTILAPRNSDYGGLVPFSLDDRGPYSYGVEVRGRFMFVAVCSVWRSADVADYIGDMELRGSLYVLHRWGRRVAVCELVRYLGDEPEQPGDVELVRSKLAGMLRVYVFRDCVEGHPKPDALAGEYKPDR